MLPPSSPTPGGRFDRPSTATRLCVASVQLACDFGDRQRNLERATRLIEEAAQQGARLVLLPELMPGGYILTEKIWDTAEPFDGPSTGWLRALAQRLGLYIGTTFIEADGSDFYNTFVLAGPDGEVAGKVRKNPPASFEAYFFRGGDGAHWFDTPLGRIGVGICFENALYQRYLELHEADIDLYLRPFSGASFEQKFPVRKRDVELLNAGLRDGTAETALAMGIPVLMSNKVGRLVTALPAGFPPQDIEFPGYSAIADSDGTLLGQLGPGREGVVVGTVTLAPARKRRERAPNTFGRWTTKFPWWSVIWVVTQKLGERAYARSALRRERAAAAATAPKRREACEEL
ncbi:MULTISPECIES: carbon-nitrogen hydrolase family protein [unclassified Janthinobacterium]|uniref:carbon-nitrogen hydrolase family protein n=1 Tax=unclassified Janthinobacterium TaxID=2610881 RepID=UPI0009D9B386|nr:MULTISPECIES: carbon-nitrogen hydrolase family protein [unclassified Janthinobacterium]MEC5161248.1 N-carbamoylputrescine amidase [Janthinobacterium sp. CG_S6]